MTFEDAEAVFEVDCMTPSVPSYGPPHPYAELLVISDADVWCEQQENTRRIESIRGMQNAYAPGGAGGKTIFVYAHARAVLTPEEIVRLQTSLWGRRR